MTTVWKLTRADLTTHNDTKPNLGPAACLCGSCREKVREMRCSWIDGKCNRCGRFRHRGRTHSLLIDTVFLT